MDEIKIDLLNKDLTFSKNIFVDVQNYDNTVEIEDYRLTVNKRLFIDYIVKDMSLDNYLNINNEIFKVIKIKTYSDYQEIFIHEVENIKVNGIDKVAIIVDTTEKIIDYKNIITDFPINTGDLIFYQNQNWLIVGEGVKYKNSYKSVISKCNNTLLFKYNGLDINASCILEEKNDMTLITTDLTETPNSYYLVTIPSSDINKKLPLGARFIFGLFVYRLIGVDDISSIGLLKLKIQLDAERIGLDDFTTGYADNSNLKTHSYSINIINEDFKVKVGDNPIQLNIELFDNKVKQASQSTDFIYQSDNEKICTIDSNGKLSFIGVGVCNITVKYKKDETVTSNINITVEPAIIPTIDKYSIKISGSSSMILGSSNSKYTCTVYNNGIEDTIKTITWSLDNLALATIFSNPSNRSCVLKANKTTKGIVKLKCMLSDDNTIFDEKSITIQSAF